MTIPIKYNLRSVVVRKMGTVMTIVGVALTVAVFVSILAMVQGLESTFIDTGDPLNLILLRQGSQSETQSWFARSVKDVVSTVPGVASVAGEVMVIFNHPRMTGETANLLIRGVSDKSLALRPKLKIAGGRMFKPGLREIVVSKTLSGRFKDARMGDAMKIGRSTWSVVGILDSVGTPYDSEIWADYDEVAQEFDRTGSYSSLLIHCTGPEVKEAIRQRIAADRRVKLDVTGEQEYFAKQTSSGNAIRYLAYFVAIVMAVGSCFAVMNTMYSATSRRAREIATLRVLGYRRGAILVSFLLESIALGVAGGVVGCLLALPVNGISTGTMNTRAFAEVVFQFQVTPVLMLRGVLFAAIMGGLGGILPARMASRIPIVLALRAEG